MTRRICVVTGSRAEYGLLAGLMQRIDHHPALTLQVAVTGMHLVPAFGETWREIVADGFAMAARIDCLQAADTPAAMARAIALATLGFSEAFERLQPELIVVLGDRFEIFAAAQAALCLRLPIAHIHGGELTTGALDDALRHAITKFSQLHFVACETYRQRVIQLGEAPERVWNVGAPALDNLRSLALPAPGEVLASLDLPTKRPYLLVTYHPETLAEISVETQIDSLLDALAPRSEYSIILTGANADPGHARIAERLSAFAATHPARVRLVASLGQKRYLAALQGCAAVLGNSSSGIIEAPAAGVPTINIGQRQGGRLRAPSVIDVPAKAAAIGQALERALSADFQALAARRMSPFGDGTAYQRMLDILCQLTPAQLAPKHFFDLPQSSREAT